MRFVGTDGVSHEMPVILHANGSVSEFRPKEKGFTLEELQKAVGGYVEIVSVNPWADVIMLVDEEGPLKRKRCNELASEIIGQYIVGDVVIMERRDME